MAKRLAVIAVAVLALVLGGCQMNMTKYDGTDAGFLVASLAMDKDSSYYNIEFHFRSRDGAVDDYLFWVNDSATISPPADFHEGNAKGNIATVRLKPGQYEFYNFGIVAPDLTYGPRIAYSIPFTIQSGKATYLGQYLTLSIPKKGLFGSEIDGAPYFVISNQQPRDIELAKKKVPEISTFGVVSAVPDPARIGVPYFRSAPLPKGAVTEN